MFQVSPFFESPITSQNCDSSIKLLNCTIYDYFSANFGQVAQATDESLIKKYKDKSKHDLKKSLKVLKHFANADIAEIECVSRLLHDKLRNNTSQVNTDQTLHSPWTSALITLQDFYHQ